MELVADVVVHGWGRLIPVASETSHAKDANACSTSSIVCQGHAFRLAGSVEQKREACSKQMLISQGCSMLSTEPGPTNAAHQQRPDKMRERKAERSQETAARADMSCINLWHECRTSMLVAAAAPVLAPYPPSHSPTRLERRKCMRYSSSHPMPRTHAAMQPTHHLPTPFHLPGIPIGSGTWAPSSPS